MCGLVGYLATTNPSETTIVRMANTLTLRGPDDCGLWQDRATGIHLAHRRLAIVDLSPAGHQPMHSVSDRYVIAFNGEIYNHVELRKVVEQSGNAPNWRGHSDTETLLAGIDAWGLENTLQRAIGMFAIALWDKHRQILTLVRDRLGEKPMYYGWQGDTFLFGSELKALKAHPAFTAAIDRNALCLYMRHCYVPAPHSIYQGIAKLPIGCTLSVSLTQRQPRIKTYWSAMDAVKHGLANRFQGSSSEAVSALDTLLKDAVRQQMMADVPLGAFLSGGVDSSTVVAMMQSQSSRPIKTFSIGFHETLYNEAEHAKAVAQHLGTDHTELYVTPAECMAVIPHLSTLYDEPFADSSQIPTYLVSQLARQHVTVSLSGDAGDELFAGYNRYLLTANIWGKLSHIPLPLRTLAAKGLQALTPNQWNKLGKWLSPLVPLFKTQVNIGDKLHKATGIITSISASSLYRSMISTWSQPEQVVIGGTEPLTLMADPDADVHQLNTIERMMALDMLTYLPDDILCKVDRASMGVSLETRVPFLDHRVVEFAWQLPMAFKLRDNHTKWVLRQVLYQYVPRALIERPKMGFGMPVADWLRGELREWAEDLLSESRLQQDGYFNPALIRQKWREHISGKRNWQYQIWNVLMFQAWLQAQSSAHPLAAPVIATAEI